MSDVFLFLLGAIITTIVASAVGLLVWGAANEPGELEVSTPTQTDAPGSKPGSAPLAHPTRRRSG
jgi:hypothetical protein